MNKLFSWAAVAATALTLASCNGGSQKKADHVESINYDSLALAQGYLIGSQMAYQIDMANAQGANMDVEDFISGFKKGMKNCSDSSRYAYYAGLMTGHDFGQRIEEMGIDASKYMKAFEAGVRRDSTFTQWSTEDMNTYAQNAEMEIEKAKTEKEFGPNREEGKKYLEAFKNEAGVQTTESGLAYKVLTPGRPDGKNPEVSDRVKVSYKGTLIDGTEFDSSEEPMELSLTGVIPGWTEMLQLMQEGEKVEVVIPYELAYGERGTGEHIKPFSTLKFEITLHEVVK